MTRRPMELGHGAQVRRVEEETGRRGSRSRTFDL